MVVRGCPAGFVELTPRERDVLALLPTYLGQRQIALRLHVSENTVKTHLKSIYLKLDVRCRAEAVVRAEALHLL